MRAAFALILLLAPALARAQEPAPAEYDLRVTKQELTIIGTALGDRPYKEAAPLIAKLTAQLQSAERAGAAKAEPPRIVQPPSTRIRPPAASNQDEVGFE